MKKLLSLALSASLTLLLLAGCTAPSGGKGTPPPSTAAPSTTSAAPAEIKWPEKPINVIIPFAPGGDTDFNARAFLEILSKELGVAVVGTNVAGSGGTVASRQVKDAATDGYNVLYSHTVMNVNEMMGTADFGIDAFDVACICGRSPGEIIVVRADLGVKTLDELKAYTEANPGTLDLAVDFGTMVNINGIQMQQSGIDVNLVALGNASERVAALAGGHCDIIINAYGSIKDYLATGEFVALASNGIERSDGFPDIPTAKEQGYEIYLEKHYFFAFPKGTDPAILEKFSAAVEKATNDPAYQESIMTAYSQAPFYATAEDGLELMAATKEQIWTFKDAMSK